MDTKEITASSGFWESLWWTFCAGINGNLFFYLAIAIIGCGGIGVWISAIDVCRAMPCEQRSFWAAFCNERVLVSVCTYMPAIVGSAICDVILKENRPKTMRMFLVAMCTAIIAVSLICPYMPHVKYVYFAAVASIFIWFITNAGDEKFERKADPNTFAGGKAMREDIKMGVSSVVKINGKEIKTK